MVRQVIVLEKEYTCPLCCSVYKKLEKAKNCLKKHNDACRKILPNYEIGDRVLTHLFNDANHGKEHTTIVRIKGDLFDMELLVENDRGERYWVQVIRYGTLNLQDNPTLGFRVCVPIIKNYSHN
ncbi:MAG: hypothetical protein HYT61_02060 [Candidatus Yanofskybacteria bacterium]|nr:hypothetical protein [Candidatus Yanofskybacteria bacterium]